MATDGEKYGHKQMTVIEQIQGILEKYPFGNQILKEVIQNADDANAERVEFMLDLDSHSKELSGLVDPSLAKYQGPALYSWNSATFCEKDWKGIEETGRSCKKEDYLKVGRFGLGFISMYHITDCPWILSDDTIIYLDPQNISQPGHRYLLVNFFNKNSKYYSHHSCFKEHYFGYDGESEYNGTLFRFPLRTGEYTSSISDEKHSIDEIKSALFTPLIQEGEHLLPFLKYINSIRIWEKVNNKISLIHSVGVADKFKRSLNSHRNEITIFADSKQYHTKSCIFIAVYPIDTNGKESIWLVMNMLGFGLTTQDNSFYKFYCMNTLKYIPWFGIALPTGATNSIGQEHTWVFDWDGNNFDSILEFINSNVSLSLHTEISLDTDNGKYYCFLPIPKQSLFPFHIHGYFALDDNRRSLKWPSAYDCSPDSEWNMYQTQRLGTVLYATFLYLSMQSLSHQEPANFHYKLIADYNLHETENSMFSILQREGLKLLLDQNLVYSQSHKWIPLRDALYAPSIVPELTEKVWAPVIEKSCIDLLLLLSEPIVELPQNITLIISKYEFLKQAVETHIISPARMREILKYNSASEPFLADRRNAIHLLEVVLWDLDPTSEDFNIAEELEGLPLILTADSSITPRTFSKSAETFYISQITAKYTLIFPGLEYLFIDPSLPDNIHDKLLQISQLGNINITDITNIQPNIFVKLLSLFLNTTFHTITQPLSWTPACNNQPNANWVKSLWEFISTDSALISAIEDFPIFPKGLLNQQTIQLLPVRSQQPYVEFDATREITDMESILAEAGCQLCHRHFFIQCFEQFVMRPVPHCLINVLRNEDILTPFSELISESTSSLRIHLIEQFNSISIESEEEKNIVKRLPIFLNFKGHWNALNSIIGQRTSVLAPRGIPDDIDYPAHILTPFDSLLVVLYEKLNINFCNEKEFIRVDLIPFIISKELHEYPETMKLLSLWVLDRLSSLQLTLGDDLVEFMRETKWLLDSSTSYDKVGQVKLYKPSGMLNPTDPLLKQLIVRSNEGFFPNEIYDDHVEKMKKYFDFKSHNNLNSRLRKEVCKAVIKNLKSKCNHEEWTIMFNALLKLIFFYFEDLELKDQESLWKEFNKEFVHPQQDISAYLPLNIPTTSTDKLFSPSEVICCTGEQITLVAYVKKFIVFPETSSPENHETYKNILNCMGFETDIPYDSVVDQLNYIIDCSGHQTCDYHKFHKIMFTTYQFLNSNTTSPCLTKLKSNFIFMEEKGEFIKISEVVETTKFNMRPYIYSYANLEYKCLELFKSMEMSPYPTAEQYCYVLEAIYTESKGKAISAHNVDIVINILEALSHMDYEDCNIYILGYDDIMYPISEEKLVFSNEVWLDRKAVCSEFPFLFTHERILRQTAIKLKIKSFYQQFVSNELYTTLNQDEQVIHEIKHILESYTDELGLIREMLQNSDDSGASQLKILFDFRTYTSWNNPDNASLLSANMHHWQGPAIWFYNDKVMQESDCDNILCLNGEGKANDVTKIGRDGKGFCSAFYLTDLPSFVSGNMVYILDPHMEYIEQNYGQSNACKIDFCENKYVRFYEDQFQPFQDLFNCRILENKFYDSTLFRIPLRSENIKSQLSVKSYDRAKMEKLQKLVIKYVEGLLLFTENINLIEIHEIRDNAFINASEHIKPIYWIRKDSDKTQSFLVMNSLDLENCVQGNPIELTDYTYECSITSSITQSPKRWFICYTSGSNDELTDVIRDMRNENCRIHAPFTSVAFDLDRLADHNTDCNSNVYSLYPLSDHLQLPYNCNGMFELEGNKMRLIFDNTDHLRISWNTNIIRHNLTNTVIRLYKSLADITSKNGDTDIYSQFLYNIFSKEMCNTTIWGNFCRELTHKLMDSPLKLFTVTSSHGCSFNCFNEVVVLNGEDIKARVTDAYFNKDFLDSINSVLINIKSFKLATIPSDLRESSGLLKQLLQSADKDRIIDMERLVKIFFESLPDIPEDLMMSILPGMIASHTSTPGLSELVSTTPCILCGDTNQLRKISHVIDPNNSILSDMYYPEENRIPSKNSPLFATESGCYKILKQYFGLNSSRLTLSCLIDRVDKADSEDDVNLAEKILMYLNLDIFNNSESEQISAQLLSHRFLPTLNNYPLSATQLSLTSPNQVVVYPLRHFLGLQRCVLSQRTSQLGNILKLLKIEPLIASDIETSLLLEEIANCEKDYHNLSNYPEMLLDKMKELYEEISKRSAKDRSLTPENFHNNCIYIPEIGFVTPSKVIFGHERSFSPYIHSIKHVYRISDGKLKEFFLSIGVEQTLTLNQCLEILGDLKTGEKLSTMDQDLALNLIHELSNKLYEEIEKSNSKSRVLLLGEDGCIHESSESIFFDLKWKEKGGYRGDIKISNKSYYFVHTQISSTNAHKLGAISLSSSITTVANKKLKFVYNVKGQQEKLTNRLRDIVNRYEATVEVFKELLQNADDANAETVKFLFDYTSSYKCRSLIQPEMEKFQGPSLYVYNNKAFLDKDFENIMAIGGETKKTDSTKIGRFGLGFNTVYHLTDVPSFVSRNYIHMLDPHHFCGERGLKIDFTENQAILQEFYFDQFSVFNNIFGCDVFSEEPYDGTLFRFPFRNSDVKSEIKQSGMFDTDKDIWKLQQSFTEILEQVLYFLQYIQNIEIYERREQNGEIKLISKVNKNFKTRPYPTSFLTHHEGHFEELADCEEKKEHVTAIEIIEICNETGNKPSNKEYILSYASGTGECIEVINKFQELKQACVRPVAAVGIPRQLIHQKSKNSQEEYKLFCFLPLPKISPYSMHINGYFHLSAYRNELHITDENAHLTQWNYSLVNDAIPNALISLLLYIREELLPHSSSESLTDMQLEKYFSYFPLSTIKEKPWESYPCKTINKIIDSNARLFPCGLHEEKWLTYTEVSFLSSNLPTAECTIFLKKLSVEKGVYFFDLPSSLTTKQFFSDLFKNSKSNYNLKRLCEELIFPNIEEIKNRNLEDLYLVVSNLLQIYSTGTNYLNDGQSPLSKLAFIPCGDVDPVLRTLPTVVHPKSEFSEIFYPDDKRLPHKDFHKLFASTYNYTIGKLGVIKDELEDKDLIDRCEIAQTVNAEDPKVGHKHSMVLLKYINRRKTVPCLTEIAFIPVWVDPLYTHLNCRDIEYLVPPNKCYSYSSRYLLTHKYFAVDKAVSELGKTLKLLKIQTEVKEPEMLIELLEVLCNKEDVVKEFEDENSFNDRIKQVYNWFAEFCFPAHTKKTESTSNKNAPLDYPIGNMQDDIKERLKNEPWIWHPFYKRFYLISQVKGAEYLSYESDFLISFPYPDLLPKAPKENNISYFFKFMGLKPELGHLEAIEILSKMKRKYNDERLKECDVKLAKRLITEEIGKYYSVNNKETPPIGILLLSETECLHPASKLYRNDIAWMEDSFSDTDKESIVNKFIPAFIAHLLGAKSKRSTYFEDESCEGVQMEDFGQNEAISDRIENIKTQLNCDVTILNELLQNAEDAEATEIAFILDNQSYPSEHLCFAADTHQKWKTLQSTPSLLVYNDKGFTERDFIGIQKVGIGGKKSRQTIGRFGIGFNAVYHLTRSPCLLTSPPSGNTTTFCIFDPYREYLNISKKSELPGKKIIIRNDKKCVFKDQLKPYELSPITDNPDYPDVLANLKSENSYSLFRFPLNAKGKTNITIKTEQLLDKLLEHSKRLLLFLKHIKRIDILCIDKHGEVYSKGTMISDTSTHPTIPPTVPEFYPGQYLKKINVTCKNITTRCSISRRMKKNDTEWLCYSHEQSIEHYPGHEKFEDKIETEKLHQIFGNIAVDITNIGKRGLTRSYLFCYLPISISFVFPVHINAPLIVEQDRRQLKFSEMGQECSEEKWEYTWHKSVIHNVLVPLYAKLIIDLSDINNIPTGIQVKPSAYYEWYYSVFPDISIQNNNSSFLELISKELYKLLHRTEQLVLVSSDLKKFSFTGVNQGIFRKTVDEQFRDLYSILNKVKYPITDAPPEVLDKLISLKLDHQVIDPFHVVNFLINNKGLLAIESQFPCQMKDSVLTKEDVFLLLGYVLKASTDELKELSEIPLKIDSRENICSFSTCTEDKFLSFRPIYASLLPHCSANFINQEYSTGVIQTLSNCNFIRDLSPEFLSQKFIISEYLSPSHYQLFWKFALEECKSIDIVIQLFGNHELVQVCHKGESPNDKSLHYYPINQLSYIVSNDLEESSPILYGAFKIIDCPFIDLEGFKEGGIVNDRKVISFLNKKAISKTDAINPEILMGCLSNGHLLKGELGSEEAKILRTFLSGMEVILTHNSAKILANLRIFVTISKTLKSISELKVCFVNENNFYIGELLRKELESQNIGIFSADTEDKNPITLIKSVADNLSELILIEKFVSKYIIPRLVELDVKEQKKYLRSISKLDESIQGKLFSQLRTIPFIQKHNSKHRVTADQLYSRSVPLFKLCLADKQLPNDWDKIDPLILSSLNNLGLNTKVNLQILRDCASIIADCKITEKIDKFISILVNFLKDVTRLTQDDTKLLHAISSINFIPIMKIDKIEGKDITYEKTMGNFHSALPYKNLNYCGTMCYILPEAISNISTQIMMYLNIKQNPPCKIVVQHLGCLSEYCQKLSPEDNSNHEHLFHKTYSYLQQQFDLNGQSLRFKCIIVNGILFDVENLVFKIKEEIYPYLFKVPSSLSSYHNFLQKIGVQQVATYTHYTSVLKCIALQCGPTFKLKNWEMEKSAKTAFSTLVNILRQLPSDKKIDLNPADTHVLTDNNLIKPCNIVYYADNTSLLAKVKKHPKIDIHILATLQPDENGSGIPPVQLQIQNLSQILIPSLSKTIADYQLPNHPLSKQYASILKSELFHRALMRLYYHDTNKNIVHLKSKDGKLYYSKYAEDYPVAEGYVSVLDRIKNLTVISVKQIDIDLKDQRNNEVVCIQDIMCCFIDTNSSILYVKAATSGLRLPTMVAQELNSFLSNIFTKTRTQLMNCFITNLTAISSDFDEQDVKNCPFLDDIKLPQSVVAPTPPTLPTLPTSPPKGPVTLTNLTNHRTYAIARRATCPRPGVDASRPDQSAAKLWIRTAQCDWRAANKLSRKSDDESTLFPPQSCFLCFEATMKALIAFLHLCGEEVKIHTTPAVANKLSELIIPLMNYDEQTRLPCMTSGMGFNTPRECYTLDMARGAIKSVRQILNKLKEATKEQEPNLESLMLEEGEGGYIETTCLSLNEMFFFPMDCELGRTKLEIDSEEFFTIARSFFATLPSMKIISIEKIMNKQCWDNFKKNVEIQVSKFGESCLMIKPLFHGTRNTPPYQIFEHPVGFCTDFSDAGMWGKGLYFAVNSSYSHSYAHKLGNGEFCMFLAQVFVGYPEARKSDASITSPKAGFHSVQGVTRGSQIHILYENGLAYPSYLITYSQ
ncbi:Sacsin-like [Oopsacas minuta]|uniref:Poly [ADP-ribose] polymerase n=1 Tax=Oopsacas minuta TaxID=111878 RepID=A0AAV7JE64_9METZ|nr:Sacsin-like [Oopsacas minuta]